MFDHLSITASDLDRAQKFYDAILAPLGVPRVNRRERAIGYGERPRVDGAPCYISIYLSDNGRARQPPLVLPRAEPRRRARLP